MAKKIRITQLKGIVRTLPNQRASLEALGLHGINRSVEHELTPQIAGVLRRVAHMVKVEDI